MKTENKKDKKSNKINGWVYYPHVTLLHKIYEVLLTVTKPEYSENINIP